MIRKGYRRAVLVISVVLIAALVAGTALATELQEKKNQLENLNTKIYQTRRQILQIKQKEHGVLAELASVELQLDRARSRVQELNRQVSRAERAVASAERELALAEERLAEIEARLAKQQGTLAKRLRALYIYGAANYLEFLVGSVEYADLATRHKFLEKILEQDVNLYKSITREAEALRQQKEEIEARRIALMARRNELADAKAMASREASELSRNLSEREAVLRRIQAERKQYEKALDEMEAMSRELENIIRKLQGQQRRPGETRKNWSGRFRWPVRGRITSDFGWRLHPILQTQRFHSGLDIAAPEGTPILAPEAGTVIYSGWVSGYGKTVIIDHGDGISTLFGHCSVLLVSGGEKVKRGEPVARVGSTGLSTGPHLHFEVRDEGKPVDPLGFLE